MTYINPLLKQVLRDHVVTEKQFFSTASELVSAAREDFIRRAYYQYLYGIPEICRVLKMRESEVKYFLNKLAAGDIPPPAAEAAAPIPSPKTEGTYTPARPPEYYEGGGHA